MITTHIGEDSPITVTSYIGRHRAMIAPGNPVAARLASYAPTHLHSFRDLTGVQRVTPYPEFCDTCRQNRFTVQAASDPDLTVR